MKSVVCENYAMRDLLKSVMRDLLERNMLCYTGSTVTAVPDAVTISMFP